MWNIEKSQSETLDEAMDYFAEAVTTNDFPSDGLVALYDDIAYGESLGTTAKFPRNAMAFKWADEMRDTRLLEIEWSPSRTGLINPVAIFEPVELEGTTVSRASVHNISIMKELKLGIGDTIRVYKANMIIPQIAENLTGSGNAPIPHTCPACGQETVVKKENDVECLFCVNPGCPAKKIKSFGLFTSRDAMNIDGLSEATLEKFIARGFIHDFGDIFEISRYKDEIVEMEGFGQKSYDNLMESLERAKETTLPRVIYSLGIANIGLANAKVICRHFDNDLDRIRHASLEEVSDIDTIGPVIAGNLVAYFRDEDNNRRLDHLMNFLHIQEDSPKQEQIFEGMNFVITGSLVHFGNRSEAKELIESLGGKVTGSVTKKTNYLINNDIQSNSSKNKRQENWGFRSFQKKIFGNLPECSKGRTDWRYFLSEEKAERLLYKRRFIYKEGKQCQSNTGGSPVKEILERENIFVMDEKPCHAPGYPSDSDSDPESDAAERRNRAAASAFSFQYTAAGGCDIYGCGEP